VNSLGDTGVGVAADHGDLRFCLSQANARPGEDLIIFSVTGTINLTKALPDISDDLIIAGPGADQLTVNAQQKGRVLKVAAGVTVQVYSVTLSGGGGDYGAGIYNAGNLTVADSVVSGSAVSGVVVYGGGIYNANTGVLYLFQSRVSGNQAKSYSAGQVNSFSYGGGIANAGVMTVVGSTVSGNTSVSDTQVTTSFGEGGGIANFGSLTVDSSTVSDNQAAAYDSDGWTEAYGGGIANFGGLTLLSSTVAANVAVCEDPLFGDAYGGGIYGGGTLTAEGSTIASNKATCDSYAYGEGVDASGNDDFRNTVVAGNGATGLGPDLYGSIHSSGHNLFGFSSTGSGYARTDLLNVNAKLGPLQDNGGPTQTMALLPGSPAIDSGDNTNAPDWDQRGPGYPRIVNGTIDRGAFEVQNTAGPEGVPGLLATAPAAVPVRLRSPARVPAGPVRPQPTTSPAPVDVPVTVDRHSARAFHAVRPLTAVPDPDADPVGWGWRQRLSIVSQGE
jgi:hypothetical protein